MFARTAFAVRRAAVSQSFRPVVRRAFSASVVARESKSEPTGLKTFSEIKSPADLFGPGAQPGTVPTDLEQATGLERLEILGKMEGVDIFDMKPLDASRLGTLENPIIAKSFGEEQYVSLQISYKTIGALLIDSHVTMWLTLSRTRPVERCPECGNVIKMEYVGDPHSHAHLPEEPKTMADFIKPEYEYN
ncbi:hypothetical protein ABW19_dt0207740 [Dactylella cylindrospora]|nr:hypothetical protein ABW19_dt0207740 [Dactylella cylindrospora]